MKDPKQIQELINYAKVAQQTERYDDMTKYAKEAIKKSQEINPQSRTLLANGFKCKISSRRTAWRALSTLQCKENNSKSRTATIIQYYKENIEREIREICSQVITFVSGFLSQKIDVKSRLQFLKMKGDFNRYLCQIANEDELKKIQKEAETSYSKAIQVMNQPTNKDSLKTSPLKLGICLNFSVFYYEIASNTAKAIAICQKGFNQALQSVSDLQDTRFTDTVTIMQLMHDNIVSWKDQVEKNSQ